MRERKRRRQREWHARKRREDAAFAESERARCAESNRRRRAAACGRPPPGPASAAVSPEALAEVVAGMVSQLTDSTDPVLLAASMRRCRERGRRVAGVAAAERPW